MRAVFLHIVKRSRGKYSRVQCKGTQVSLNSFFAWVLSQVSSNSPLQVFLTARFKHCKPRRGAQVPILIPTRARTAFLSVVESPRQARAVLFEHSVDSKASPSGTFERLWAPRRTRAALLSAQLAPRWAQAPLLSALWAPRQARAAPLSVQLAPSTPGRRL